MIQVYTGNGKGKTTAALGLAFRAIGQGKKVLLIQFLKKGKDSGELKAAQQFPRFKILQAGRTTWARKDKVIEEDQQAAQKGWRRAQKAIASKEYDLIILDELNVAVEFGLIKVQQVKEVLQSTPRDVEVVITGRSAHPQILEIADLISEIRELKHYYKKGIKARPGIEY